jgi:hypothetical protein
MIKHHRITKNGKPGLRVTFDPTDPYDLQVIAGLVPSSLANDLQALSGDLNRGDLKSLLKFSGRPVYSQE